MLVVSIHQYPQDCATWLSQVASITLTAVRDKPPERGAHMANNLLRALLFLVAMQSAFAEDTQANATEATVRELLETTRVQSLMQSQIAQIDAMMRSSMQKESAKLELNAAQQRILEEREARLITILKQELNYAALEPKMVDLYRNAFTESEMKNMLEFYRTPAGKAVIDKMPIVVQQVMQLAKEMMDRMLPKVEEWKKETAIELKAAATVEPRKSSL